MVRMGGIRLTLAYPVSAHRVGYNISRPYLLCQIIGLPVRRHLPAMTVT